MSRTDFRSDDKIQEGEKQKDDDFGHEITSYELQEEGLVSQYGRSQIENETEEKIMMTGNMFRMSKWFFDTPGIINNRQVSMALHKNITIFLNLSHSTDR